MPKIAIGVLVAIVALIGISVVNKPTREPSAPNQAVNDTAGDTGQIAGVKSNEYRYAPAIPYSEAALAEAQAKGRAVIMFHADWCPMCQAAAKSLRENKDKIPPDVTILGVDYDTATDLKKKYGISMQDTYVQVDRTGKVVSQWNSGGRGIETLLTNLKG